MTHSLPADCAAVYAEARQRLTQRQPIQDLLRDHPACGAGLADLILEHLSTSGPTAAEIQTTTTQLQAGWARALEAAAVAEEAPPHPSTVSGHGSPPAAIGAGRGESTARADGERRPAGDEYGA